MSFELLKWLLSLNYVNFSPHIYLQLKCLRYILITACVVAAAPEPRPVSEPCQPSPCGPNANCQVRGESPACSCLPNYIGSPPNCRPECTINPECSSQLACINQRCSDPCPGSCGYNAQCSVINHTPVCSCTAGHTGDPFTGCSPVQGRVKRHTTLLAAWHEELTQRRRLYDPHHHPLPLFTQLTHHTSLSLLTLLYLYYLLSFVFFFLLLLRKIWLVPNTSTFETEIKILLSFKVN